MAAPLVLLNAQVLVGSAWTGTAPGFPGNQTVAGTVTSSVDISPWVTGVSLNFSAEQKDTTTMSSNGWSSMALGKRTAACTIDILADYSAGGVIQTLQPYWDGGGLMYLDIKPTATTRSTTNPSYVLAAYLANWTPFSGKVGDVVAMTLTPAVVSKAVQLTA
jgi:hypothetical protein